MDDSLWSVDNDAAEILALINEAPAADDLADIADEIRNRAGAIVAKLAPEGEVIAWHEQTYTEECDGETITDTMQVPEFAERTSEQVAALIGQPAFALLVAAQKIDAATLPVSDVASFLAALEPLCAELKIAREAIAPAVQADKEYHDYLADMTDTISH